MGTSSPFAPNFRIHSYFSFFLIIVLFFTNCLFCHSVVTVVSGGKVYVLDLAAKLDGKVLRIRSIDWLVDWLIGWWLEDEYTLIRFKQSHFSLIQFFIKFAATADFLAHSKWGKVDFPPPFGRDALPEEAFIADLDAKSGASLKLTVLNAKGRIWTMVAGGGASVIYADTICDLGGSAELANYGEYSGAPTEHQTYEYAKTILSLMTKEHHPQGKVLIIGGGIANFTNVAATFSVIFFTSFI